MKQHITIQDIARTLKLGVATVSRALNNHPAVKPETRELVIKTAKQLDYQPNRLAVSLKSGKTNVVGVMVPSADISFFGSVVHGIEKIMSAKGYSVLLFQTNESYELEKKGIQTLMQAKVEAVMASISKETINLHHFELLAQRNIPLILFDRANELLTVPAVVVDDYKGAFTATEHLIVQGCRRIAHIGGQQHVANFNQRLKGYIDALNSYNIPVDEDLIVYGKVSVSSGEEAMELLLPHNPDGVFAVEDFTALGALQAIKKSGRIIPEEIALIGFANEPFGQYISPALSTVNQHTIKMGEVAAQLFFENDRKSERIVLAPELIIRESSKKYN